jgi:hypothetical protein
MSTPDPESRQIRSYIQNVILLGLLLAALIGVLAWLGLHGKG